MSTSIPTLVNDAVPYGVRVDPSKVRPCFRCISVHHLTGAENQGRHNIFFLVYDAGGNRLPAAVIRVTWEGMQPSEQPPDVKLDKPPGEYAMGDFPMYKGQRCTVRVIWGNASSDLVINLHTGHADEDTGNTLYHHSFLVVFQLLDTQPEQPPAPDPAPTPPQPVPPPTETVTLEGMINAYGRYCRAHAGEPFLTVNQWLAAGMPE